MFENRYTITEKIYVDWTVHPVLLGKSRRRFPLLLTVLLAACAVMLVMAFADGNGTYSLLYALLLAGVAFRLFGYDAMLSRRQFRRLRAGKPGEWKRVLRFDGDGITVEDDGQVLAEKTCGQLQEVRDMEPWLALIFEGGVVVRADKGGFFREGAACGQEAFLAFLRERCPGAAFPA